MIFFYDWRKIKGNPNKYRIANGRNCQKVGDVTTEP